MLTLVHREGRLLTTETRSTDCETDLEVRKIVVIIKPIELLQVSEVYEVMFREGDGFRRDNFTVVTLTRSGLKT